MPGLVWVDGRLQPRDEPALRADDSAFSEGRGCYTTARWQDGRPRFEERHVARLVGAAKALRIGDVDPEQVRAALNELGRAEFGDADGVVRVSASRDGSGRVHLVGVPRPLGEEPERWSATIVGLRHESGSEAGLKVTSRLTMALAGDAAREAGCDEALLLDGSGHLVEGSRSNIFVVSDDDVPVTPPVAAGPVAGVARGVVLERVPEAAERPVPEARLRSASEVIAVNAVRGARPIVSIDGAAVGSGQPGPWAARLAKALAAD